MDVVDQRKANANWNVVDQNGELYHRYDSATLAVLMDIRRELQQLNRLLGCPNFTGFPAVLRAIRRNTEKPKPKKAKVRK